MKISHHVLPRFVFLNRSFFLNVHSIRYIEANYVEVKNVFMILEFSARVFDVVLNMPGSMIAHRNPKSLLRSSYLRLFSRTHLLA